MFSFALKAQLNLVVWCMLPATLRQHMSLQYDSLHLANSPSLLLQPAPIPPPSCPLLLVNSLGLSHTAFMRGAER